MALQLNLTEKEVRELENRLREYREPYGPGYHGIRHQIWRKAADACNLLDDAEYRRLYGVPLPAHLRK